MAVPMRSRWHPQGETHVDIVNPPAEYTAASANPTIEPETIDTSAATALQNTGNTINGQNGGRFLFSVLFSDRRRWPSPPCVSGRASDLGSGGFTGGDAFCRYVVSERKRVNEAKSEHRRKVPPTRRRVQ
jgi:hypothetical protein